MKSALPEYLGLHGLAVGRVLRLLTVMLVVVEATVVTVTVVEATVAVILAAVQAPVGMHMTRMI